MSDYDMALLRIEHLEAEIEQLRALVREFAEIKGPLLASTAYMLRSKARDVLGLPKWMR